MLIISMMIDDVKIYCGYDSTSFIINNVVYTCDRHNLVPTKQIFNGKKFDSVCYGVNHTIFKSEKEIYSMGKNDYGELGLGDYINQIVPQKIMFGFESMVTKISCGMHHTMIITKSGEIYGWGLNYDGQLGLGTYGNRNLPTKLPISDVESVSCGLYNTFILTSNGYGYGCGENDHGQLGLGDRIRSRSTLQKINLSAIISISCGACHTVSLTSEGKIYSWGLNYYGQLGLGDDDDRPFPQKNDLLDLCVISVSCGSFYTMILTSEGKIFGCGSNLYNQLGMYKLDTLLVFQLLNLNLDPNETILSVNCGDKHTIITTKYRKYYGWGHNNAGQLGLGDTRNRSEPTQITFNI